MVILTGKALRTVDQQMYVFFRFIFRFRPKKGGLFRFRFGFGRKKKWIFRLLLFFGRKREIHFRSASCLELPTGESPRPRAHPQQLQTIAENEPLSLLPLGTHSAVEMLHDTALYKSTIDIDIDKGKHNISISQHSLPIHCHRLIAKLQ